MKIKENKLMRRLSTGSRNSSNQGPTRVNEYLIRGNKIYKLERPREGNQQESLLEI